MNKQVFLYVSTPMGDRILRNIADVRHIRLTQTKTGELQVLVKLFGEGPDGREKPVCTGPDSRDYFDWIRDHPAIEVMDIWEDKNVSPEEESDGLDSDDQEE